MSKEPTKSKKYHLLTPIVGGLACGADCPFCVAHMTPSNGVTLGAIEPDYKALDAACAYVRQRDAKFVLLTSKGEPTNWPHLITEHLRVIKPHGFERVELQTNGIRIADRKPVTEAHLAEWRDLGLGLVAISIVHHDAEKNRGIYTKKRDSYIDLAKLIADLHKHGFAVRLATVMLRNYIDTPETLAGLMKFARDNKVEELTVRPVNRPENSQDDEVSRWITADNYLLDAQKAAIQDHLDRIGKLVKIFHWGGRVYDVDGQNVCFTNSLTHDDPDKDEGRQLIFFPEGKVSDDWSKPAQSLAEFDPTTASAS